VRALGATPASTWVIGDGVQDIVAGKAAGCRTAAVLGGFTSEDRLRATGPDVVLRSLEEIGRLTPDPDRRA
jgi:phosphoglycolate phosphatase-like HAD superfamily hydrolase